MMLTWLLEIKYIILKSNVIPTPSSIMNLSGELYLNNKW